MAISNPIRTSNDNIVYEIAVAETATSAVNNTSTISVNVNAWSTKSGYTIDYEGECYLKIDGVSKTTSTWSRTQKPIVYGYENRVTLYSGSFTITHNQNGTKNIQIASCFELFFDGYNKLTSSFKSFNVTLTSLDVLATELTAVGTLNITSGTDKLHLYTRVFNTLYNHTLTISDNNTTVLTISGLTLSDGSNEYTLTANDKSTISAYMSTAGITSFVATYTLTTYANSISVGSVSSCNGAVRTILSSGTTLVEFRSGSVKVNGSFEQTVPNMEIKDGHILKILRW